MISHWAFAVLGACFGAVVATGAMFFAVIADGKTERRRQEERETEAYKNGVIAGSRWKEAEKKMLEEAVAVLRDEIERLKGERG